MKIFGKSEEEQPDPVLEQVKNKFSKIQMPAPVVETANKELELLRRIGPSTSEYTIGLTYLEYLASMPWNIRTLDDLDIYRAETILNEAHYGLTAIKERILEHLAVRQLNLNKQPRILIIDDEEIARKNLKHILSEQKYIVETASSGTEAIDKYVISEFDIILTDLKMGGIGGLEILERTKAQSSNTEVIVITGYASIDNAVEVMKKGAFHYIVKPFKVDDVISSVKKALEKIYSQKETKGPVLCFSGPPGTGKTSMGRSIARALGRKFARISLGGIKDEAEIRGHRKTYAGAMPGRIIEEIRRVGSMNPVIILDEMDKIGYDFKGDPASALLEALDPEQNSHFTDHYLDLPFDLSEVMFIITANIAENIIDPLRDRMEVIRFTGYTEEEKANIASQFLIPRQIKENGLSGHPPQFTTEAVLKIIQDHTREAGIRNLEREIASACRKIAMDFVKNSEKIEAITITPAMIEKFLGPRKYFFEVAEEKDRVGVTTGLVWTDAGGDIIFTEAVKMKGKQELILTGSLGDVMRESAQAALSYIRSNASKFGIPDDFFEGHDIHIHVPAGSIPKDGPSAGTTIALALISLLTDRPAKRDVAISGELTLSGRMLPVGGVREKVLAAKRARLKTIILPAKNKVDVEDIPHDIYKDLTIQFADKIEDIVDLVLK